MFLKDYYILFKRRRNVPIVHLFLTFVRSAINYFQITKLLTFHATDLKMFFDKY